MREAIGAFDIILTRKISRMDYVVESPYSQLETQVIKREDTRKGFIHSIHIERISILSESTVKGSENMMVRKNRALNIVSKMAR